MAAPQTEASDGLFENPAGNFGGLLQETRVSVGGVMKIHDHWIYGILALEKGFGKVSESKCETNAARYYYVLDYYDI